jgi:hypothetical protein
LSLLPAHSLRATAIHSIHDHSLSSQKPPFLLQGPFNPLSPAATMRPSTLLPFLSVLTLTHAQKAPFSSLAAFNKSLPACAQAVQDQVFAQALGVAPYGCAASTDPTKLVESTNGTEVLCICVAARVPQAPLESFTYGSAAFEGVATAACTKSETSIQKLFAETQLLIELCMGLENGTYAGDLSSNGATQTPAAGEWIGRAGYIAGYVLTWIQQRRWRAVFRGFLRCCLRLGQRRWLQRAWYKWEQGNV